MKSRYNRPFTKKEAAAIGDLIDQRTTDSLAKVQWIMIVALNDALGIGEKRILRVLEEYPDLLKKYGGFKKDGVSDEMLARRVKQILPKSFERLYDHE